MRKRTAVWFAVVLLAIAAGLVAGNGTFIKIAPSSNDFTCTKAGTQYGIYANGSSHKLKACQDGVLSDLLGGGSSTSGESLGSGTAAIYRYYANALDAASGGVLILSGSTTPDYDSSILNGWCSTCKGGAFLAANGDGGANVISASRKVTLNINDTNAALSYNDFAGTGLFAGYALDSTRSWSPTLTYGNGSGGSWFGYHVVVFDSTTGNVVFDDQSALYGGFNTADSLTLGANVADGVGDGNTSAQGPYLKLAGYNGGGDGGLYLRAGLDGVAQVASHSGSTFSDFNDGRARIYSSDVGGHVDLAANTRVNIYSVLHVNPTTTAPASPSEGDIYIDDSHAACVYLNGAWVKLGGAGTCS